MSWQERHVHRRGSSLLLLLLAERHSLCKLQGFRSKEEVQRFADMMEEMCYIVATKNSGSLKGEHGTGRNMAPFVEMEWGTKVGG